MNLIFRFDSELPPVRVLKLKVEIKTREHFSVFDQIEFPFSVESGWFSGSCKIPTYSLEELLGTKMRALYQRNKGRDLFDLWMGLNLGNAKPSQIIECFHRYLELGNLQVSRDEFENNLIKKIKNNRFLSDIRPLIRANFDYDVKSAMKLVMDVLISALK